jgi:hypothetical protein
MCDWRQGNMVCGQERVDPVAKRAQRQVQPQHFSLFVEQFFEIDIAGDFIFRRVFCMGVNELFKAFNIRCFDDSIPEGEIDKGITDW